MQPNDVRPLDIEIAHVRFTGAVKTLEKLLSLRPDANDFEAHVDKIRNRLTVSLAESPLIEATNPALMRRKIQSRTGKLIALADAGGPQTLEAVLHRYRSAFEQLTYASGEARLHHVLLVRDPVEQSSVHRAWEMTNTDLGNGLLMAAFRQGRPDAMVSVAKKLLAIDHPGDDILKSRAVEILFAAARLGSYSAEELLLYISARSEAADRALNRLREYRVGQVLEIIRAGRALS